MFLLEPVSSSRFFLIEGCVDKWLPLLLVGSVNIHMILRSRTKLFQLPCIQSRKGSGSHSNMKELFLSEIILRTVGGRIHTHIFSFLSECANLSLPFPCQLRSSPVALQSGALVATGLRASSFRWLVPSSAL